MDSRPSKKLLVSACLAGINCTFRGKNNLNDRIKKLAGSETLANSQEKMVEYACIVSIDSA